MQKINVGLIGLGRISDLHVLGYQREDRARLFAVCDIRRNVAEQRAQAWGAEKWYTDYRSLLEDKDVDAVEILTPHHLHAEMTVAALEAGKHVSVQKPMARNMSEVRAMVAAADKSECVFRVYENFRFYPAHLKAKELIDAGEIGEPVSVRFRLTGSGKGTHWEVPSSAWRWRTNPELCGGGPLTFDHAYHIYSMAPYLVGPVEKVFAWISERVDEEGRHWDGPAMICWKHKGGEKYGVWDAVIAEDMLIHSRYYADEDRLEVTGSKGIIWVTRCTTGLFNAPPLIMYRDGQVTEFHDLETDWASSFVNCTRNFIDSICGECPPQIEGREAAEIMQFALAVQLSASQGREVRVEEITG